MRKLTILEALTLLKLHNGELSFFNVAPDDYELHKTLEELSNLELIDPYALSTEEVLTKKGIDKIHQMLSFGLSYDSHFKRASIEAKRAAFLSLLSSGYQPRGLWHLLMSKGSWGEIKKAFYDIKNSKV